MTKTHKIITARHPVTGCSEQPLTGLDINSSAGGFTIALVYAAPLNERMLVESLQRTLDDNPYFSGRLFGLGSTLPLAIPNNEGVLFSHISCKEYLSSEEHLFSKDHLSSKKKRPIFDLDRPLKPYISRFVDAIETVGFDHHTPLLQVRLTNFVDGSILGISISRALCDAVSMLTFLHEWAERLSPKQTIPGEVAQGEVVLQRAAPQKAAPQELRREPLSSRCWNRRDLQLLALGSGEHPPRESPVVELDLPPPAGDHCVETCLFHLSASLLEQLCRKYGTEDAMLTRQDIATAFLFVLTIGCQQNPLEPTSLTIACNIRRKLELPANYLGNAVIPRHFELNKEQLAAANIGSIAQQIRRIQTETTADGLRRELAFWQRKMAEGATQRFMPLATYLTRKGGILIDNMAKFDFYALNFGAGKPLWIDTPAPPRPTSVARSVLMLPAAPDRGGIDIHISLPPEEMKVLRRSTLDVHRI